MARIDINDTASQAGAAPEAPQPEEVTAEVIEPEAPQTETVQPEGTAEDKAAAPEAGAEGQPSLADDLAAARKEADELRDRFVRLQAEWDNYRKRTAAERADERSRATERLVTSLLPVVDDLDRALEHVSADASDELKAFVEGITGVQKKLSEVLAHENVEQVGAPGDAFDPIRHQAVGKAEDPSVPDETVTQVYQRGYIMGGKVLRPAMVVVSTGGPAREPEAANEDSGQDA